MNFHELHLVVTPDTEENRDIFVAQLADLGYDSFMDDYDGTLAYIKASDDHSVANDVSQLFVPQGVKITFTSKIIKDQNWNAVWESNFEPITVDGRCMVRASFHEPMPNIEYDIVIDPKMSFGTGHHQTTHLIIEELLKTDLAGKQLLDMGCGTGVLAILAEKRGATNILAIDNDEWAYNNAVENIRTNHCEHITTRLGNATLLNGYKFNIIVANINLNILLADMQHYIRNLTPNGLLLTSGILSDDAERLIAHGQSLNLRHIKTNFRDSWAMVEFSK